MNIRITATIFPLLILCSDRFSEEITKQPEGSIKQCFVLFNSELENLRNNVCSFFLILHILILQFLPFDRKITQPKPLIFPRLDQQAAAQLSKAIKADGCLHLIAEADFLRRFTGIRVQQIIIGQAVWLQTIGDGRSAVHHQYPAPFSLINLGGRRTVPNSITHNRIGIIRTSPAMIIGGIPVFKIVKHKGFTHSGKH